MSAIQDPRYTEVNDTEATRPTSPAAGPDPGVVGRSSPLGLDRTRQWRPENVVTTPPTVVRIRRKPPRIDVAIVTAIAVIAILSLIGNAWLLADRGITIKTMPCGPTEEYAWRDGGFPDEAYCREATP